jgi:hypothetical protein
VVEYLFEQGADIGHMTRRGGTALFWAKMFRYEACVGFLENIGAPDLNATEEEEEQEVGSISVVLDL